MSRPNAYDFTKYLNKNVTIEKKEKVPMRLGRTNFKRYFGNGNGKDQFIINDNGGNWQNVVPTAMNIIAFNNKLRHPPDNVEKEDKLKK